MNWPFNIHAHAEYTLPCLPVLQLPSMVTESHCPANMYIHITYACTHPSQPQPGMVTFLADHGEIIVMKYTWSGTHPAISTLRPRQHGRHFADDTFKCIFMNENVIISIKIWLKFVPEGPINHIPALVEIMACRRPGDKPLSEPMVVRLPTHICVTLP